MFSKEFLQFKQMKFALPIFVVAAIIVIFKGGYAFGQWLYHALH